jgi:abortive infection bacteriophage resistance protein
MLIYVQNFVEYILTKPAKAMLCPPRVPSKRRVIFYLYGKMPVDYPKPPLSLPEQLDRLTTRGMIVASPADAEHALGHLNYYRLRAYWYPFEQDRTTHVIQENIRFEDVLHLYQFDHKLRLLFLDALGQIEISLRTQWALHFCLAHGAFAYLEPEYSHDVEKLNANKENFLEELGRSTEQFIKHFRKKYTSHDYPPIWMACEVMSFGLFSRWYKNLSSNLVKERVATCYELDQVVLPSVMEHFVYLRNVCAHHGRLWNRSLVITSKLPKNPPTLYDSLNFASTTLNAIYNSLVLMKHFLYIINPHTTWHTELRDLLETPNINLQSMGFPADWQSRPYWQIDGK